MPVAATTLLDNHNSGDLRLFKGSVDLKYEVEGKKCIIIDAREWKVFQSKMVKSPTFTKASACPLKKKVGWIRAVRS
ncbi:MAG TPA: hypothetical protein VJP79_01565, partial [Nitrososphaera sp.]|nr:hypothetical protein [Nitrososphaera sp.]